MSAIILIAVDTLWNTAKSGKKQQYFSFEDAINKPRRWACAKVGLNGRPIM